LAFSNYIVQKNPFCHNSTETLYPKQSLPSEVKTQFHMANKTKQKHVFYTTLVT